MATSFQLPQNRAAAAPLLCAQRRWLRAGGWGCRAPFLGQITPVFTLTQPGCPDPGQLAAGAGFGPVLGAAVPRGRILHGPSLCPEQPQHQRGSAEDFWAVLLQGSAVSIAPTSPGEKLRCKPVPTRL